MMPKRFSYLRDPAAIYTASQEAVGRSADLTKVPEEMRPIAVRLVHACGMPEILDNLAYSRDAYSAGREALLKGAAVLADSRMVVDGIIRNKLPTRNHVITTINEPAVVEDARLRRVTRAAAAVEMWQPYMHGAIVAIGNAPTALFRLLEMIADGAPWPALIVGVPVGFVGAAEAKQALIEHAGRIPYITLRGRFGGSALAAAVINALAVKELASTEE